MAKLEQMGLSGGEASAHHPPGTPCNRYIKPNLMHGIKSHTSVFTLSFHLRNFIVFPLKSVGTKLENN